MEDNYRLGITLMHYWRPGTGKGSGSHVDATVDLDHTGCPFIAGKMLKGLLRDAVLKTTHWNSAGWPESGRPTAERIVEILFGSESFQNKRAQNDTSPGLIRVGNALLPEQEREWLANNRLHRNTLFRDIYSTAINSNSGMAKKGSLRGQQVVVPLELYAEVSVLKPATNHGDEEHLAPEREWVSSHHHQLLKTAVPLVRAVGANRTRGFGRAKLSLEAC